MTDVSRSKKAHKHRTTSKEVPGITITTRNGATYYRNHDAKLWLRPTDPLAVTS